MRSEPESSGSLSGARIVLTRPTHQSAALAAAIRARGGTVLPLPLLTIADVPVDAAVRAAVQQALAADRWIFTSVNAVHALSRFQPPPWSSAGQAPEIYAVGTATAAALQALGVMQVRVPEERFSLAAVAALDDFRAPNGATAPAPTVVLMTGEDASAEGVSALQATGVALRVMELYRRVPVTHSPAYLEAVLGQADAVLISSAAGWRQLQQLQALTSHAVQSRWPHIQLVVPSARVVELIHSQQRSPAASTGPVPLVPQQISDLAYVQVLEQWWAQARNLIPTVTPDSAR